MDLFEGIKHIIDGDAVIIMGAGASYGAKNAFGDFPSGSKLAIELYKKCGITPDDENDLQDAAQCFIENYSPRELITEIRSLLTCASFTESHEIIYTLPWMRYYTTNYDDVALLAAKKRDVSINPVTLSCKVNDFIDRDHVCVHINGHIGNLNEATLNNEFKLTSTSYLSETSILESQWGSLLTHDLEVAKCIFIIGLSLKYDLDLNKIIFSSNISRKTIIIDRPSLTQNSENRLRRYGTVYKIGVDGFSNQISRIQESYKPRIQSPTDMLYSAFDYQYKRKYHFLSPKPEMIFKLFFNGQFDDSIFYKTNGKYDGFIYRSVFNKIKLDVINGKRFIFIHSDMGNGKTACITELCYVLSRENIHLFVLSNADSPKISKEINTIYDLSKESKVVVIVDDYTNYMDVMHKFSIVDNGKVQFVLTARTALNHNKVPVIFDEFGVKENESSIFDINRLENVDLQNCVYIFDKYGLFGRLAGQSKKKKIQHLSRFKGGAKRFQSIMLDILQSDQMKKRVVELINIIQKDSDQYHSAVLLILLVKIMNLRLSVMDIERISGVSITTDALFKSNAAIKELISFNDNDDIEIKAPVTARFVLQKVSDPDSIIDLLCKLAKYAENYSDSQKYSNILNAIISYSHINSFMKGFDKLEAFLLSYYDKLSDINYYTNNHFFWLQYAISCIKIKQFDRAQRYLETSYALIPEGFEPFQINNQQAVLYLERIKSDLSVNPENDFLEAHKLLMMKITSPKDNEYSVVHLFGYYIGKKVRAAVINDSNRIMYESCCKDAYNRVAAFLKKYPMYSQEFSDLQTQLLSLSFSSN